MGRTAANRRQRPDDRFEIAARQAGARDIAGIDEVGRGPLAGPVMAAAVILDPCNIPDGLDDSKRLSPRRREALHDMLMAVADVSLGQAEVDEIEELNVLRASHLAMHRAIIGLSRPPDHLLIDGKIPPRGLNQRADMIVGGDARSLSIAAASIVAKVARDRTMADLAQTCPGYGWETNAGYPTKAHRAALEDLGVTPYHRRTFRPVHKILYGDAAITH